MFMFPRIFFKRYKFLFLLLLGLILFDSPLLVFGAETSNHNPTPLASPTSDSSITNQKNLKRYRLPIVPWEVGQSATYQIVELVNNKTVAKEGEETFSIVGEERHDGRKYVSLEIEKGPVATDGHLINPMHFKIVLPQQNQESIESFIYDGNVDKVMPLATISDIFVGLPASFQPVTSDNKKAFSDLISAMGNLEKNELQNAVETQQVSQNTPAGNFITSEYENIDKTTGSSSAFWRTPEVPIWGLVKTVDVQGLGSGDISTTEMILKSYTMHGATTHINKKIIVMSLENRKRMFGEDGGKFSIKVNNLDQIMKSYKK